MHFKAIPIFVSIVLTMWPMSDLVNHYALIHRIDSKVLANWRVVGIGNVEQIPSEDTLQLTEGDDSKGVVLLSEAVYGPDLILRFKVKPLQHEGIPVVIVNASNIKVGEAIEIPDDYDGNFDLWKGENGSIQSYIFAFHTGYHQPNAFVTRNPGFNDLDRQPDLAVDERWYDVEIGAVERHVWLKIDGQKVLDARDRETSPLPAGHIGLRLRGPGDGSFSALYKEVTVEEFGMGGKVTKLLSGAI